MAIDGWRIHRRIGMSGGLFTRAVGARARARAERARTPRRCRTRHGELFRELLPEDGARCRARSSCWPSCASAASCTASPPRAGGRSIDASLEALGVPDDMVVVKRGDVARAKPEPDLFLECARRLGAEAEDCYVVGDAVWDLLAARRARMLSIGLLSGGYGEDELAARGRVPRLPRRGRAARLARRTRRLGAEQRDPMALSPPRALGRPEPAVGAVAARDQRRRVAREVAHEDRRAPGCTCRREVPGVRGERDACGRRAEIDGCVEAPSAGGPPAPERARDEHACAPRRAGRARRRACRPRRRGR